MVGVFFIFNLMHPFIQDIQFEFSRNAHPERAIQMADYMKNHFVFLGIRSPERMVILKPWLQELQSVSIEEKFQLILQLWALNEREYQMAALEIINRIKVKDWKKEYIAELEMLITTKSWWDSVDLIASSAVGRYFQAFPEKRDAIIQKWSESNNIWLQRSTLIFQLKYKTEVDFDLLVALIKKYQHNNEFFIQKAIGWSLRQYSKVNPEAVASVLPSLSISNLAIREASKYL